MPSLNKTEKELLRLEVFKERPTRVCEDCGGYHLRACPRIRRQKWIGQGAGTGNRVEVEYWEHWDDSEVLYPEDVWDEEEEDNGDAPGPIQGRIESGHGADGEVGV